MRTSFPRSDRPLVALLATALALATSGRSGAADNLQGFVDVTGATADVSGVGRNSLSQQYSAHWTKRLVPFVTARASFRYLRLDIRDEALPDLVREELQPAGELQWGHPEFSLGATARRRTTRWNTVEGDRVSDNVALNFGTSNPNRPRLTVRYDWDHNFDRLEADRDLDTEDERFQAGLRHTLRGHDLLYSFTRRRATNIVSGVRGTENTNIFRWDSPVLRPSRRLTVTSNYTFTHRAQTQERPDGGRILVQVPGAAGLYAEDSSPALSELASVPTLTDLNTTEPTVPPIDIGGALIYRNIGLDFGFERVVSAMYVYTDRLSGVQPGWDVWVSRDNVEWEIWDGNPAVVFNPESSRYEIAFPTAFTRYVKVVNLGMNEESEVFVTEAEALAETGEEGRSTRSGGGHRLDLGADYEFTERIDSSLDASYESVPFSGAGGERRRADYALGARYRQIRTLLHNVRWQQGFNSYGGGAAEERTSKASYTLLFEPLQTLRFTTSLDGRLDHRNGERTDEFRGIALRAWGTPIRGANLSSDINRSRTERHDLDRLEDLWSFRISADGSLTRTLTAILTYSHRRVTIRPGNELRVRNQYTADFDYRVTRTIFARGTVNLTREFGNELTQDYLVSWNVAPKLTLGGQVFLSRTRLDRKTDRYGANLTYNLTARSTLYSSYTYADFMELGGIETASFQLGLRAAL